MKKILIFTSHYYPGFLSGGIAQSILNTSKWLGNDFRFFIITQDRDLKSDKPYLKIKYGEWMLSGKSKVRYLAPNELSFRTIQRLINEVDYDLIHLNSFFDLVFTIKVLLLNRLGFIRPRKILLSPRGEFVNGPLHIKYFRKKFFIIFTKMAGFYKNVNWHASVPLESRGIANEIGVLPNKIKLAIDLPIHNPIFPRIKKSKHKVLRVFFVSRITREKNLDGALRILQKVKAKINFHIIGPLEDPLYWRECKELIKQLPYNITVRLIGPINPKDRFRYFTSYDLLLFPTHGENYGHVIAESISVGTRVLISQFTPWRNLADDGVGWDLDNSNLDAYVGIIEKLAYQSVKLREAMRLKVRKAAKKRLFDSDAFRQNYKLYSNL